MEILPRSFPLIERSNLFNRKISAVYVQEIQKHHLITINDLFGEDFRSSIEKEISRTDGQIDLLLNHSSSRTDKIVLEQRETRSSIEIEVQKIFWICLVYFIESVPSNTGEILIEGLIMASQLEIDELFLQNSCIVDLMVQVLVTKKQFFREFSKHPKF